MFSFTQFQERSKSIEEWLAKELSGVRTGKASPALLDNVTVDSYGSKMPIAHVAAISTEDARTLRISPWDKGQVKSIETAIAAANLGISTVPDASGIRVIFPELSTERRVLLGKIVGEKLEEARISIRKAREETLDILNAKEKAKEISEDEKFKTKEELQKKTDEVMKKLEEQIERKKKELSA